jgi:hypothetical protein
MNSGRLVLFLIITLAFPARQVVVPQRDVNAEEAVSANFARVRRDASLPALHRAEGSAFAQAACEAAAHGNPEKIWVENAAYAAVIYSTAKADDLEPITNLAARPWKGDQRLVTGACFAQTPAFPTGRYWVAVGVIGNASDKSVADLLAGRPLVARRAAFQGGD